MCPRVHQIHTRTLQPPKPNTFIQNQVLPGQQQISTLHHKNLIMRHRVSLVHSNSIEYPISEVDSDHVFLDEVNFAREDKYTITREPLSHIKALRVHVTRDPAVAAPQNPGNPFAYEYQYGVHIYVVPQGVSGDNEQQVFFQQINEFIGAFMPVELQPERMVLSLNSFYFHSAAVPQIDLSGLGAESQDWSAMDLFLSKDQLTLKTFEPETKGFSFDAKTTTDYTEIGVFHVLDQSTRDDLILSGLRVIYNDEGSDGSVLKTMFHVKPRHRRLQDTADITLSSNGMHPILSIDNIPDKPSDEDIMSCTTYAHITLDKSVFVDTFQVPDDLSILANYGTRDIELPEYALKQWGNELMVELDEPILSSVSLTLHSRYQLPNQNKSHTAVQIAHPVLFHACDVISDSYLLKSSPFDNKRYIGGSFEKYFTEETVFYHFLDRAPSSIEIPNATGNGASVNLLTLAALLLGTTMVLLAVWRKLKANPVSQEKKVQ